MHSRRDLLLALAILREGFCDADSILQAATPSGVEPEHSLGELLVARGLLQPAQRELLESEIDALLLRFPELGSVSPTSLAQTEAFSPTDDDGTRSQETIGPTEADQPGVDRYDLAETASFDTEDWIPSTQPARDGSGAQAGPRDEADTNLLDRLADPPPTRDRYRLGPVIGRGGMGLVLLAYDRQIGREVALKVVNESKQFAPYTARFLREARIPGQLDHPNIVTVHEVVHGDGRAAFFTMHRAPGVSLSQRIKRYHESLRRGEAGPLELADLLDAFISVCNAVGYAHSRSVIHRDLKPSNIMVGDFGEVLVIDWGLAKPLSELTKSGDPIRPSPDVPDDDLTNSGAVLGTPPYMPLEQALGQLDRLGPSSDIYSLGAVLYEILCGRRPYSGPAREVLAQVVKGPPPPPREVRPEVPPALEAICLKAMDREPESRYATALDLAAEVRRWLVDEPVEAYPEPLPQRLARWARGHRTAVASAAALLLTSLVALGIGFILVSRERDAANTARDFAERQQLIALSAEATANQNQQLAEQVVDRLLIRIGDDGLAHIPQFEPVRLQMTDDAVGLYRSILATRPADLSLRYSAAQVLRRAANMQRVVNQLDNAMAFYQEAEGHLREIVDRQPSDPLYRHRLSELLRDRGSCTLRTSGPTQAEADFAESLRLALEVRKTNPGSNDFQRTEALARLSLGVCELRRDRQDTATEHFEQALQILEKLADSKTENPAGIDEIFAVFAAHDLASSHRRAGRPREASEAVERAIRRGRQAVKAMPEDSNRQFALAGALRERALQQADDPAHRDRTLDDLTEAHELSTDLVTRFPRTASFRLLLVETLTTRAIVCAEIPGKRPDAEKAANQAFAHLQELEGLSAEFAGVLTPSGACLAVLGRLALLRGERDEAAELLRQARERLNRAIERNDREPDAHAALARVEGDFALLDGDE